MTFLKIKWNNEWGVWRWFVCSWLVPFVHVNGTFCWGVEPYMLWGVTRNDLQVMLMSWPRMVTFPVCDGKISGRGDVKEGEFVLAPGCKVTPSILAGSRAAGAPTQTAQLLPRVQNRKQRWGGRGEKRLQSKSQGWPDLEIHFVHLGSTSRIFHNLAPLAEGGPGVQTHEPVGGILHSNCIRP